MKKSFFFFLIFNLLMVLDSTVAAQYAQWKSDDHHKVHLKGHPYERKMKIQNDRRQHSSGRIEEAQQAFRIYPQVNGRDFRYQIFIGFLLMGSCIAQSNAYAQEQPLSINNPKALGDENTNLPSQRMYVNNTCPQDLSFQKHAPSNDPWLGVPWSYPVVPPDIHQQKPTCPLVVAHKPLEEKELFRKVKSLATKTRRLTYSKLYPNHLEKAKTEAVYNSFRLFLPKLRTALDQTMAKGKKLGLILGERHMGQECDLFNQLVINFVKIYLKDIQALYSEGNKELLDMLNNEAKAWQTKNRPFRSIKNNEGKAWGVGKVAYFENIGLSVKHTEASNLGSGYMSKDISMGLIEASLCVLDAPIEYCKKNPKLKKYFNNYCPSDLEERNKSIVETLHVENSHFIGIFGLAHLPSLHNKLRKDTHNYLYISSLTREEAKGKESEMSESLKILSEYTESVVGKQCTERISKYINPYSFTNYWESENVFSISYDTLRQ